MLFKPKIHRQMLRMRMRCNSDQQSGSNNENNYTNDVSNNRDQSCIYDIILCGSLRNCMFKKSEQNSNERKKRRVRCVGLTILSTLSIITWVIMELCHLQAWTELLEMYAPHYSEVDYASDQLKSELDRLHLVKSVVSAYILIFALLLRVSYYITLPIICLTGSPIFFFFYIKWMEEEHQALASIE